MRVWSGSPLGWSPSGIRCGKDGLLANWLATAIAALALVVSMATAIETYLYRRRQLHGAQVTAYFHWNQELSRVDLPNGETIRVGYNLVLWNQGPATARDVRVEVRTPSGDAVQLAALEANEFPLRRLDAGGRYPIQFAPVSADFRSGDKRPVVRRFDVLLAWADGNGRHEHVVPLRRGQASL